jgi:imidazolonepropionase-like amidohydrolase
MNPMDVIRSMSSDAADVMGARDNGAIAAGQYADIIVVGGDPFRHIIVLRDPTLVIRHGRRHK